SGKIVMAGGIDIHFHIAGGNGNSAPFLLPAKKQKFFPPPFALPFSTAKWSTFEKSTNYRSMGFTTVIEPAIVPHQSFQAHLELSDIPIIDKGILTVLGNDDFLLSILRDGESPSAVSDYVGSAVAASNGLGIKCINAGGATAFKYNV